MSVRYQSVDGEILYQSGAGGRIDYLPGALGSVLATTKPNQPDQVDNTYRYKPYGGLLDKSGTGIDPQYLWVGSRTYRDTSLPHASHYMVARHYGEEEGRWTTVDPLCPNERAYGYCLNNPTSSFDKEGLRPQRQAPWEPRPKPVPNPLVGPSPIWSPCVTCSCWNRFVFGFVNACKRKPVPPPHCQLSSHLARWYYRACKGPLAWGDLPPFIRRWEPENPLFMPPSQIVPCPITAGGNDSGGSPIHRGGWPTDPFGPPRDCRAEFDGCLSHFDPLHVCDSGAPPAEMYCRTILLHCIAAYLACLAGNAIRNQY